jgi:hypothetical protein
MEKSTGRKTTQLEVVWHEVAGDNSHHTADQIYERVRRHIPNIWVRSIVICRNWWLGETPGADPGSDAALRCAGGLAPPPLPS